MTSATGVIWLPPLSFGYLFECCHFAKPAQMALGMAEFRCQIRFDKLPCDFRSDRAATHAQDVHVVVFHALVRRKMIANQAGTNSGNLVSRDRGADTAAADRDAALHLA